MTHASLFSGIGGPEIAAAMLGWENLFHCEINPFGRQVLDYWFPNSKSYEDITKTDFTEWRGRVDVLTGGFPCQPFSYAGQRRGADDDRYLWPYMFKAIDTIRPAWVVAENVAGITTMVEQGEVVEVGGQASLFEEVDDIHRYRLTETFTLQRICDDLESHGYAVQPVLIPACAVGAPHRRDRVFIVARRVASDTDSGADRRTTREDAGKGGKERIQERHEVRKPDESNQVRPEDATIPQDSMHSRQLYGQDEVEGSERNERNTCTGGGERLCSGTSGTDSADTNGTGQPASDEPSGRTRQTMDGERIGKSFDGTGRPCSTQYASDTDNERLEGSASQRVQGYARRRKSDWIRECAGNYSKGFPAGRWDTFPTVSPVHRGNDGLPFDVDSLSIPFSKWRTESLKAYGNAIVPQVMYEIFRAIELVSNQ